ncbi:MAG: RDD family protein, partial [Chloroflexota bacterium]|nr:RDD family protein [Chloroflexota bacterium]
GYFPLFEWLRGGQTPGKVRQGIRVVRTSGEPAGFAPVMVRNLLRIVEVYALPFIALISMFVTVRGQRLGDLAAGTMVVSDRELPLPATLAMAPFDAGAPALDTSGLTEREYAVLRTFLARRTSLDPAARRKLAASLAARLRRQLDLPPTHAELADETLIQAAVRSYRSRYASRNDGP